jgi:hypothetical protein
MFAQFDHLLVVDDRDLGVPKPGYLSVEEGRGLDQVRASLGDVQALGLGVTALAAERDEAAPTPKIAQGRKAQNIADKGDEDGCTDGAELTERWTLFQPFIARQLSITNVANGQMTRI